MTATPSSVFASSILPQLAGSKASLSGTAIIAAFCSSTAFVCLDQPRAQQPVAMRSADRPRAGANIRDKPFQARQSYRDDENDRIDEPLH